VFRSPVSGFVIEKQAIAGLHVVSGQSLYKVADLSTVWVEADIYETDTRASIKRFTAIFEPVVILVMGMLIGSLILSMLLAITSINEVAL